MDDNNINENFSHTDCFVVSDSLLQIKSHLFRTLKKQFTDKLAWSFILHETLQNTSLKVQHDILHLKHFLWINNANICQ